MLGAASASSLVAEHGRWLFAFLRGLTESAADAEDAFQETWLRVMRAKTAFDGERARAYLARTARSVVIDRFRRHVPTESLDAADEAHPNGALEVVDDSPDPSESYDAKATAADVRRAIAALPENLRHVVLMRVEGELTFAEIADQLDVPLGTVLTWMRRATVVLKRALREKS